MNNKKKSVVKTVNQKKVKSGTSVKISSSGRLKKLITEVSSASGKMTVKKLKSEQPKDTSVPLMVSVSGIRGVIGKGFYPEVITRYASAFGTWANGGTIIIGRDSRVSGEMVRTAVIAGLMATGCKIIENRRFFC